MIVNYYRCRAVHIEPTVVNGQQITIRRHRSRCPDCETRRADGRYANRLHERAKCLTEYFQGLRPTPLRNQSVSEMLTQDYEEGRRLLHLCQYRDADEIAGLRERLRLLVVNITEFEARAGRPLNSQLNSLAEFDEMMSRQADITQTGRPITEEDRFYNLDSITVRLGATAKPYMESVSAAFVEDGNLPDGFWLPDGYQMPDALV